MSEGIFRYFHSAVLDMSDQDRDLRQHLVTMDRITLEDLFFDALGHETISNLYGSGFKFVGDIVGLSRLEFANKSTLCDAQVRLVEQILTSMGIGFEMNTWLWRDYRAEVPEHFSAVIL